MMVKRLLLILVVASIFIGLIAYSRHRPRPAIVSGFVEADEIRLGSRVGGRVASVHVQEGQRVLKGDLLIELEPFDLLELEREAEATLAARQAEYQRVESGFRDEEKAQAKARYDHLNAKLQLLINGPREQEIEAARAQLLVARSTLKLAEENHRRAVDLVKKGAGTREQFDRAADELQVAQAMLIVREQELSLLEAGSRREEIEQARAQLEEAHQAWELAKNGFRQEEIHAAQAARDAAQAALDALQARKKELQITAPVDGTVEALELQRGDLTPAGAPVLSIVDDSHMWVRAYVPQGRLHLKIGQELQVTVDSYPEERFAGELTFISRQAEFTPSNVQTPDERAKQVFRIKVMLKEGLQKLLPGMAADVWLEPMDR
jgi:multidrug resistance efflux pump